MSGVFENQNLVHHPLLISSQSGCCTSQSAGNGHFAARAPAAGARFGRACGAQLQRATGVHSQPHEGATSGSGIPHFRKEDESIGQDGRNLF